MRVASLLCIKMSFWALFIRIARTGVQQKSVQFRREIKGKKEQGEFVLFYFCLKRKNMKGRKSECC